MARGIFGHASAKAAWQANAASEDNNAPSA
jgi:hypothetical protein